MTQLRDHEFEVVERGEIVQTQEIRPYGGEHTILVYCFECPVVVRRTLVCQQCDRGFSYELEAVLQWEQAHLHATTKRQARERLFARERQRTTSPDHDNPVLCPHCGAAQGAGQEARAGLASVLAWFRTLLHGG